MLLSKGKNTWLKAGENLLILSKESRTLMLLANEKTRSYVLAGVQEAVAAIQTGTS